MDIDPAEPGSGAAEGRVEDPEEGDGEDRERPPDESTMLGVPGVQAEVEAETARVEAELEGEAPPLAGDDAEV
jgi:hypothetical protein